MLKKSIVLGLCVLAAVGLTGCPGTACFGIDSCQLQGTWEASVTVGGFTTVTNRMVINDDTFVYTTLTGGFEGTYEINAFKDPKQINFKITQSWVGIQPFQIIDNTPRTTFGIYEVSKDTFTLQFGSGSSRPVAFDNDDLISMAHVSTD